MFDRFAVIADVHGNADALSAVLSDIDAQGVREIINLGDHFSGPLDPGKTAALLADRPQIRSIRGNHDRWLISTDPEDMGPSDRVAYDQLSADTMQWLQSLPPVLSLNDEIFACHGTPISDNSYWSERVSEDGQVTLRPHVEIAELMSGLPHQLFLCGHSHLPRKTRLDDGRLLVNPGSVGCPAYSDEDPVFHKIETGDSLASYAIIERQGKGWSVCFRQVDYDVARMVSIASDYGRSDWARAVETGFV